MKKGSTVFVLLTCMDHEGCVLYKVFSSRERAEKEKSRLETLESEYIAECERTAYDTDMEYPTGCHEHKVIKEVEVL